MDMQRKEYIKTILDEGFYKCRLNIIRLSGYEDSDVEIIKSLGYKYGLIEEINNEGKIIKKIEVCVI